MGLALRYVGNCDAPPTAHFTGASVGLEVGQRIPIPSEGLVLGRSSNAGLRVASGRVARLHARVTPVGDALIVDDLNSTNGTQLRGPNAAMRQVGVGDSITLAESFEFEVVQD